MPLGKAIRTVLSWMTFNEENGHEIELRIPVPQEQKVCTSCLSLKHNDIYVRYVNDAPGLVGKTLHQWNSQVNYQTLTLEEIIRSVQRANITNFLRENSSILKDCVANAMTRQPEDYQEEK